MFTECPSCKTLFRITEDQLASVGGKVRCGFCYGMFNAYDFLFEGESAEEAGSANEEQAYQPEIDERELEDDDSTTTVAHPTQLKQTGQTSAASTARVPPPIDATPPTAKSPRAPNTPAANQPPNLLDAISMAGRELHQVTRTQLDSRRNASAAMSRSDVLLTAGWASATFFLLLLIAGQFAYYKRDDLARYPAMRPLLQSICGLIGCTIPLLKSPQQIRLISRDIRNHPTAQDALQVRAMILNEAPFAQPYPLLRLDLTDVAGNTIASRQFHPEEYLPPSTDMSAGFGAKQKVEIQLDILDTQHTAVGFEFAFQ